MKNPPPPDSLTASYGRGRSAESPAPPRGAGVAPRVAKLKHRPHEHSLYSGSFKGLHSAGATQPSEAPAALPQRAPTAPEEVVRTPTNWPLTVSCYTSIFLYCTLYSGSLPFVNESYGELENQLYPNKFISKKTQRHLMEPTTWWVVKGQSEFRVWQLTGIRLAIPMAIIVCSVLLIPLLKNRAAKVYQLGVIGSALSFLINGCLVYYTSRYYLYWGWGVRIAEGISGAALLLSCMVITCHEMNGKTGIQACLFVCVSGVGFVCGPMLLQLMLHFRIHTVYFVVAPMLLLISFVSCCSQRLTLTERDGETAHFQLLRMMGRQKSALVFLYAVLLAGLNVGYLVVPVWLNNSLAIPVDWCIALTGGFCVVLIFSSVLIERILTLLNSNQLYSVLCIFAGATANAAMSFCVVFWDESGSRRWPKCVVYSTVVPLAVSGLATPIYPALMAIVRSHGAQPTIRLHAKLCALFTGLFWLGILAGIWANITDLLPKAHLAIIVALSNLSVLAFTLVCLPCYVFCRPSGARGDGGRELSARQMISRLADDDLRTADSASLVTQLSQGDLAERQRNFNRRSGYGVTHKDDSRLTAPKTYGATTMQ